MKRKQNTTALKFKFINNGSGAKISITQMNNKKRCLINYDYRFELLDKACDLLEKIDCVSNYSNIVDNTQQSYYLIQVETKGNSFPDLINIIKNLEK